MLRTDITDWKEKITAFQEGERAFLKETGLDDIAGKLEKYGVTEQDIDNTHRRIQIWKENDLEENIIKNYLLERKLPDKDEIKYYISYMVRKKEIGNQWEQLKTPNRQLEEWKEEWWESIEKPIPEQQLRFYLHSYLRCLQANDKDAQHAGELADSVAKLTEYVFESGKIADKQTQSEFFAMVGEELGISEEEFETLF